MLREWDLNEVTDGKKYSLSDMVKADCNGCKGCSACCHDMGSSIILDPLDLKRISEHLGASFHMLLGDKIELNIVDGIILPNLKMSSRNNAACVFLNSENRCSIHSHRPGICRIFPLGRIYENGNFSYILQIQECQKSNKSKVKVSKWIDTPDLTKNQKFISDWHYFLKDVHQILVQKNDDEYIKKITMQILQFFYIEPYNPEVDFYEQFYERFVHFKRLLKM